MTTDPRSWARRAGVLVAARLVAQVVSFAWVLLAARSLSRSEMGAVGVGLTVLAVTSAVAELGTTRSVVRHGWEGAVALRPTLVAALRWRLGAALLVGAVVAFAASLVGVPAPATVVVLAVVVSGTSGVVDLLLAALRSVGSVRTEAAILVGERSAFLVVAGGAVARGGGATTVLVAYALTNLASLAVAARAARRTFAVDDGRSAAPLLDAEGRRTAVATAVGALLPRVAAVVVAVGGTAGSAAAVAVAQRPFDALVVLVATGLGAVHPAVRRAVAAGDRSTARRVLRRTGGAATAVAVAALVVAIAAPGLVLRVLSGDQRYADAGAVLVAAAVVAVLAAVRQTWEIRALAEERAGAVARAESVALVVGLAVGVVALGPWGAAGAVAGQAVAEAVAAAGIAVAGRSSLGRAGSGPPESSPLQPCQDGPEDVGGRHEGDRWEQLVEGAAV